MRIGIVNDVALAIEAIRRVLLRDSRHQVAWVARDGQEAVESCAADLPDLVLMDLTMPRMDGVEATRRIMARTPCAIVVVTGTVSGNASKVFDAMGAGALDAVNTPVMGGGSNGEHGAALLAKVQTIQRLLGKHSSRPERPPARATTKSPAAAQTCLVAIGASAGGPAALAGILSRLPVDFPAAIVIVQHVDAQFAPALVNWLKSQTVLPVRLAARGDRPQPGTVLVAGGDEHLVFGSPTRLEYVRQPADCTYRPSVDIFFRSAERFWQGPIIGVLLTGMGRDGAEGLGVLRRRGHYTIAQNRASSAVYGMPKAAVELEAAHEVLALDKIAGRLTNMVKQRRDLHG